MWTVMGGRDWFWSSCLLLSSATVPCFTHRLTQPASPTTTGKVERFHKTLRREFLDHAEPFETLLAAQAAVDT
jgi:hypothetical protein